MKNFIKKQLISLLLVLAMLLNFIPFGIFTSKVYAKTQINEIRLTSTTTTVQAGELPQFSVYTTTEHVTSIDEYGSNTCWLYRGQHDQAWKGYGLNTPTAVEDGTTHYAIQASVNLEAEYEFGENAKIYFNDVDITNDGYTEIKLFSWGGKVAIDLGAAGHELETYTITYDANGGSGTMATDTARELTPKLLPQCTFTPPEGKVFDSWRINGISGYNYNKGSKYTFTSDTTVYAVWKDNNYIRTSNATMTPNAINSNMCANDLVFTSAEPEKYTVALWRVYDLTDDSLNTTQLNEYPHDAKFVEGHVYSIETEFSAEGSYEYDVSHEEYGSRFYINGQETVMSKLVDIPYSNLRKTERTAVAPGEPAPTHTVTFHLNGGTMASPESVMVNDGSLVETPHGLSKEGNTFAGWFTDDTFSKKFMFNLNLISSDTDIYAKWTPTETKYTVKLDPNNNTAETNAIKNITSGASVNLGTPASYGFTIPNGKQFDGWQIGGNKYAAGQSFTVTSNLMAVAQWVDSPETFSVTFNLNYNGAEPFTTINNLASGSKVNAPSPNPTRNGYTFEGWFKDQTCTTPYDFENDTVMSNTIIYAKWTENNTQKITFQLDNASVSGNVITFDVDGIDVTATVNGTDYVFNGNNLIVELSNINNLKLALDKNFDKSKMNVNLNGQVLAVNGDNEITFGGLNFDDDQPHLQIQSNNGGGGQQIGGPEDISFDLTWNYTYIIVNINGKEVLGESDAQQDKFSFKNITIEQAGETDENKNNVIRLQNRFGDKEVSEYTINNVKYNKKSNNVKIDEFGWAITVPGAAKYIISATGDPSIPIPKTIIWANPDYVPENKEDAEWVSGFTVSHGMARVVEVYDENDNLLNPDIYTSKDANEYGLDKGFGWVSIMSGSRVVFEFVPEYGYQLTEIAINETPLDAVEDMNRFEVYIPNDSGNLHFAATFTKTEDIVKADSKKVKSGEITLGENLDAGSAQLMVNDITLSSDKIKGFENAAGDYTISNYLDIDLYNVFYKGKDDSEDVWSNKIDELEKEATIKLKLEDGITADDIVIVHNIHDGDKYEIIKIDSYDPETNTITFKTKSFSNYAIASKTKDINNNESTKTVSADNSEENDSNTNVNDDATAKDETTTKSPKTGDKIVLWAGLMAVSAIGLIVIYKFLKRD